MSDNETCETLADIVAEKRRRADEIERDCAEKMKRGEMISDCYARELVADIRREADRLEAAHRRELAASGNAAKLREAIDKCVNLITEFGNAEIVKTPLDVIIDIEAILKAALSAPPRNCDVMDWRTAWKTWREKFHPETPVGYSAVVKGTEAFMDWFTAPATEQEGGAK